MAEFTRRDFLRLALASGAVAGVTVSGMGTIVKALAADKALPPVIWLQGQSCSGCSVSLLNATYPEIHQVITGVISLKYHSTIMSGTGDVSTAVIDEVIAKKKGRIVMVVEGSIPTRHDLYCTVGQRDGHHIPFGKMVEDVARSSQAALAIGTCSAFGGIPAAEGNVTGATSLSSWLKRKNVNIPVINVPGCPPHPDWMVGAIAHYLWYGVPELDDDGRPKMFYPNVHENCERYSYFEEGKFAKDYGEPYCLYELGCKGPIAHCDVMKRGWNNGVNNCISCGAPCIGCTEPTFPDHGGDGLRGVTMNENDRLKKFALIGQEG